jgi:hypothetical protein
MAPKGRRKLTRQEWLALNKFSYEGGRFWKEVLRTLWEMGKAPDVLQPLHAENLFGWQWLRHLRLADPTVVEGDVITLRRDPLYDRYERAHRIGAIVGEDASLEEIARELYLAIGDAASGPHDDPAVIVLAREICWRVRPEEGDRYEASLKICSEKHRGKDKEPPKPTAK